MDIIKTVSFIKDCISSCISMDPDAFDGFVKGRPELTDSGFKIYSSKDPECFLEMYESHHTIFISTNGFGTMAQDQKKARAIYDEAVLFLLELTA